MNLTRDQIEKVRQRVSRCLNSLGGDSGHLAAYGMVDESFHIIRMEGIVAGVTKYSFEVDAYYESEFTVYEEDGTDNDPFSRQRAEHLSGYIGLDNDYNLARDEKGEVIFGPWHYVDPASF